MRGVGLLAISLLPAEMLLLALAGHPRYGFFLLLGWVVSGGAALIALMAHDQDVSGWLWVMVGILILFNPLVPIHLRRDTWRVLDLGAAALFVVVALRLQPSRGEG
ncbi:MAG: DUF6804 family protein [Candidatus Methylomirabilales bacterium]